MLKCHPPQKRMSNVFRSGLKFPAILKRLDFQGPGSGFCLPIGDYSGPCLSDAIKASFDSPLDFRYRLRFSRQIAWLSSFEKRGAIPRNPLPMA